MIRNMFRSRFTRRSCRRVVEVEHLEQRLVLDCGIANVICAANVTVTLPPNGYFYRDVLAQDLTPLNTLPQPSQFHFIYQWGAGAHFYSPGLYWEPFLQPAHGRAIKTGTPWLTNPGDKVTYFFDYFQTGQRFGFPGYPPFPGDTFDYAVEWDTLEGATCGPGSGGLEFCNDTAKARITVEPGPPPTADSFSVTTSKNSSIDIDFFSHTTNVSPVPYGLTLSTPSSGMVIEEPGATDADPDRILYTPNFGFTGTDTFTYTVVNPSGFDTGTITVNVEDPNVAVVKPTSTISGQKFDDLNGNGIKDVGEPGLPGWTIQLDLDDDGTVDGSTTTDANGNYTFRFANVADGANVDISKQLGYEGETTIAINPANPNNLIAAANSLGNQDFVWVSTDGGGSWQSRLIPVPGGVNAAGDPTVVFNRDGSRAVYVHLVENGGSHGLASAVSTDGGLTWEPAQTSQITPPGSGDDREYLAVGPYFDDLTEDRFYLTWDRVPDPAKPDETVILAASSPDGIVWTGLNMPGQPLQPVQVSDSPGPTRKGIDAIPTVGPNGEVYVVWDDYGVRGNGRIFFDVSTNGGQTWSRTPDTLLYTSDINLNNDPLSPPDRYTIPAARRRGIEMDLSLAVDRSGGPHRGWIYLCFTDQHNPDGNPSTNHDDTDIFIQASKDGGVTWNALGANPVRVNDDAGTNSQFFPWMDVDPKTGLVAVAWYDARNDNQVGDDIVHGGRSPTNFDGRPNTETQFFAAVSFDGGANFAPNFRVSAGVSNANAVLAHGNTNQYGDYTGLAFYDGTFYPIWADNSNSTDDNPNFAAGALPYNEFDIYTAKVRVIFAGTHKVSEVLQPGYRQTLPGGSGAQIVTLSGGSNASGVDFGNFRLPVIEGAKYIDSNADGVQDDGEPGISGWTIFLNPQDTNSDAIFDSGDQVTTTDANGHYEFVVADAADYTVGEQTRLNWQQTDPDNPGTYQVHVAGTMSGEQYGGNDFGNFPLKSILSGRIFEDDNGDTIRNLGEPPLAGWTVFIDLNADGVLNNHASGNGVCDAGAIEPCGLTDSLGQYAFLAPGLGAFRVRQVLPAGWQQTTPNPPAAILDPSGVVVVERDDQSFTDLDFGDFHLASVSGQAFIDDEEEDEEAPLQEGINNVTVFADLNHDGLLNAGEPFANTDVDGTYTLPGLPIGTYTLRQIVPEGYVQTSPLSPGTHTVVVTSSGWVIYGEDFGDISIPPTVQNIETTIGKRGIATITFTFSKALAASAANPNNFEIRLPGKDEEIDTADDRSVAISSAAFVSPAVIQLTLASASAVRINQFFQVTVFAAPLAGGRSGINDAADNQLDGNRDGAGGDNFIASAARGTKLKYLDGDGDAVSLSLKRGSMLLIRDATSGEGQILQLFGTTDASILSGGVTRPKHNATANNGTTTLQAISGLGAARNGLSPTQFIIPRGQISVMIIDSILESDNSRRRNS